MGGTGSELEAIYKPLKEAPPMGGSLFASRKVSLKAPSNTINSNSKHLNDQHKESVRILLAGDVMLGRGVDQLRPVHNHPILHEGYMKSAEGYVELAERESKRRFPRNVGPEYVWGDLLKEIRSDDVDARIINLETSVTTSDDYYGKGINYRMHPANVDTLTVARIQCCVLGNNHVMDWGTEGLLETVETLHNNYIQTSGAGKNAYAASAPAVIHAEATDVLVFSLACDSSGVPRDWTATTTKPGVHFFPSGYYEGNVEHIVKKIQAFAETSRAIRDRRPIIVVSIHWGPNWGYRVEKWERKLAHTLIRQADVDIIYGHSSHHPKGFEIFQGKLILYGCGDLLNDYEGIKNPGEDQYRPDLTLLYFPTLDAKDGSFKKLEIRPLRVFQFQLQHANEKERTWLASMLNWQCKLLASEARAHYSSDHPSSKDPHVVIAQNGALQLQ